MRQIKFRCWSAKTNTMHELEELVRCEKINLLHVQQPSYIIEQFTGLQDCNGVEIYEGDILRVIDAGNDEEYQTVVYYDGGALSIDVVGCDYDYTAIGWALENCNIETLEIIGNIHENKELLN